MTDKSTFVLKLTGIDLDNIQAGDVARLLGEFCKLLGNDNLHFDAVYSGSAVFKVNTQQEYYAPKLELLNTHISQSTPALDNIHKVIRKYEKNFQDIDASIYASLTAANDEDMELIHHINHHKPMTQAFEQTETFLGKLIKPAHGKDETDHFTILLANDTYINISVPKLMSLELASYLESLWRFDSLIQFTGKATYEMNSPYQLKLKEFTAQSFEIVENNVTAKSWMTDFIRQGDSGWQDYDDPIQVWLEERHS